MIVVTEHALGPHPAGEVVEIPADSSIDIERLLDLGAVREASAEEAVDACPFGQSRRYMLQAMPRVLTAQERLILGTDAPAEGSPHAEIEKPVEGPSSDNVAAKKSRAKSAS